MATKLPTHPDYLLNLESRSVCQALYLSTKQMLDNELIRLPSELNQLDGNELFGLRKKLSFYENKVRDIVKRWIDNIFNKEIVIDPNYATEFSQFLKGVTGPVSDKSLTSYLITDFVPWALTLGYCSILIDSPSSEELVSAEDDLELKAWIRTVSPLDLVYWEQNARGKYTEVHIAIAEAFVKDDSKQVDYNYFRRIYKLENGRVEVSKWKKLKDQGETYELVEGPQVLDIDEIPLYTLRTESWVEMLKSQLLQYWNLDSQLAVSLAQHGHPWRWMRLNTSDEKAIKDVGKFGIIALQQGEEIGQIDASDPVALKDKMTKTEAAIERMAMSRSRNAPVDSKLVQSAEAIVEDARGIELTTNTYTDVLTPFLDKMLRGVAKFYSVEWSDEAYILQFIEENHVSANTIVQLNALEQLSGGLLANSVTFQREKIKRSLMSEGIDFTDETVAEILKEIGFNNG